MAVGSLRNQHSKRKIQIFSFRVVCSSIANHPFLLFVLLFLICLHRYSPFLFSLLVSASPVLVCTAVLLGTLLIHGKPNEYNLKYHEDMSNAGVTLRNGSEGYQLHSGDREGIFFKDRFAEVRNDIVEKSMKTSGMLDSGIKVNDSSTNGVEMEYCNVELGTESKMHIQKSNGDPDFANFERANVEMSMEQDYGKRFRGDRVVGVQEQPGSSLRVHKHVDGTDSNQVDTNNQESSECESDVADKSSFDALVADVIPTAQETHPLLDSEEPLHLVGSHEASLDYAEFQSLDSNLSSEDSGEDDNIDKVEEDEKLKAKDGNRDNEWPEMEKNNQNLEDLISRTNDEGVEAEDESEDDGSAEDTEVDDDDDDDDEDNEEKESNNAEKDAGKQVTMWTEEDEKNMRLVGNSEFERDLRLENLLARRRAKRNFSMISEKNLIDLDRPILSFNCAPISTARVNPFDVPSDANHQYCNIPPIPGSAPSVSVPKRNPFDSPCTSPKGIQDPLEDHVLKEEPVETNLNENGSSSIGYNFDFVEMNRKDAIFRRYESFSSGYNYIGESSRQDFMETEQRGAVLRRHETFNTRSTRNIGSRETVYRKMRPVFVPEHMDRIQEARRSSSSHDSDSTVSSFDSDHTETLNTPAKHDDAEPSKDTTAATAEVDHVSSNSEDTGSESSSDVVDSIHDNSREEYEASLEVNAEVHADQIYNRTNAAHDQNRDNASSNTASEDYQSSENNDRDENEDEVVNESELSPKASSVGTIEPPVFDTSPTGTEKSTAFSSSHSPNEMEV